MKLAGLRRKKVEIVNVPAKLEKRMDEFQLSTLTLDERLHEIV